jgi:hypothetical protein
MLWREGGGGVIGCTSLPFLCTLFVTPFFGVICSVPPGPFHAPFVFLIVIPSGAKLLFCLWEEQAHCSSA